MIRYIQLFVLFFFFYACHREDMNTSVQDSEFENLSNDVFDNINTELYDSLIKCDNFQYLAALYKDNRDVIYTCTDEELSENLLKADTICALINYYSNRYDCPDLSLYILKYVNFQLAVQSRCLLDEAIEDCWKRAWDFYDQTFENKIYTMVTNPDDVKKDLTNFLPGSYSVDIVFRIFNDKNKRPNIEFLKREKNGLINLLRSSGLNIPPVFDGDDLNYVENYIHNINRVLHDKLYWYYVGGYWQRVGIIKRDVCHFCGGEPCICSEICHKCKNTIKNCKCCKKCGHYNCICYIKITPAWEKLRSVGYVDAVWRNERIRPFLESFREDFRINTIFNRTKTKGWSVPVGYELGTRPLVNKVYSIPDFEDCYLLLSNNKVYLDVADVCSFLQTINTYVKDMSEEEKESCELSDFYFLGYIKSCTSVYALASKGKLGIVGMMLSEENSPFNLEYFNTEIRRIETDSVFCHNGVVYHYEFSHEYDKILYQCMKWFEEMDCDVEILKLLKAEEKRNDTGVDVFKKGWYSEISLKNEEEVIK